MLWTVAPVVGIYQYVRRPGGWLGAVGAPVSTRVMGRHTVTVAKTGGNDRNTNLVL